MRKVKDQITGEFKDQSELYKVTTISPSGKKVNRYYTSEAAYKELAEKKEYWVKTIDEIMNIMGYSTGMKFPTTSVKRLKELGGYGYKVVYNTVVNNRERILSALNNRVFKNEYGKLSYIFAIIENHVMDEYKKAKNEKIAETSRKPDVVADNVENIGKRSKEKRDLSSYLMGDL